MLSLCGLGPTCHEFASKDEIPLDVTFNQMSGAIGSLLLIWSGIEKAARDEVIRFYGFLPPKAHGIKAVLRTWESTVNEAQPAETLCSLLAATLRSQLEEPLDVRNGICHGLIGISAAVDDLPAQLRWEMNDQKHSVSWDDLQTSLRWLSKIRFAFSMISNPAVGRIDCRVVNTIENREWWRAEWGLLLP
jgi:hypothetical protein